MVTKNLQKNSKLFLHFLLFFLRKPNASSWGNHAGPLPPKKINARLRKEANANPDEITPSQLCPITVLSMEIPRRKSWYLYPALHSPKQSGRERNLRELTPS